MAPSVGLAQAPDFLRRDGARRGVAVHHLGLRDYHATWMRMRDFTQRRAPGEPDQIWLLQHRPVFTQGASCRAQPRPGKNLGADIPLLRADRGGQITYHGPGQLIAYPLLDIRRRRLGPKSLVAALEGVLIHLLADYGIVATRRPGAPGVYVGGKKIAALGLRISRGCSLHGLSLNVDMDLSPYQRIDPCGYPNLAVTQMRAQAPAADIDIAAVEANLAQRLGAEFG